MKRKEIEKKLKNEAHEVPDLVDEILLKADGEGLFATNAQTADTVPPQKQKSNRRARPSTRRILAAVASIAACFALILPLALRFAPTKTSDYATVCMKINPAVEFTVANGEVTNVRYLNEDAAVLLVHEDLKGLTAEDACLTFASLAKTRNLITADGITLYVTGKDEGALEKKLQQSLTAKNYELHLGGEDNQAEVDRLVAEYRISKGKARLVVEVKSLYPNLTEKRLVKTSSEDLHELLEDYREEEMENFIRDLASEYDGFYARFISEVSTLLTSYRQDLTAINGAAELDRADMITSFNQKYATLGEDFLINERESWREAYEECLEELDEIEKDLQRNADKTFYELFEDYLEDFQESLWERD